MRTVMKKKRTCHLILIAALMNSGLLLTSCRQADPVRTVWTHAVRGEYSLIKETYIANAVHDPRKLTPDRYNIYCACQDALIAMGDDDAMIMLTEMLEEGFYGSFRITRAVACSGSESAITRMFELADSDDPGIRESVASGISNEGCLRDDPRSIEALCKLAGDSSPEVRSSALYALGSLATGSTLRVVRPVIEKSLNDADSSPRMAALSTYAKLFDVDAQPLIRERTKDEDSSVREAAFRLLHLLPEEEALDHFQSLAGSSDERMRQWAAGVAELNSDAATKILVSLSEDPSEDVRGWLSHFLENPLPDREKILLGLSRDPSPRVRNRCPSALLTVRTAEASDALRRLLEDPDEDVVTSVVFALSRGKNDSWRPELIAAVSRLARSSSEESRSHALRPISSASLHELEELVVKLTDDRSLWVCREAFRTLHELNPERLRAILGD